jgi:hypothetical protein
MAKTDNKESVFVDKLTIALQKNLKVEREVKSDCRTARIDIIATTKEGYRFGIECKRYDEKRGEKVGEYIKQAERYSKCLFNGFIIPIFIAPPLSYHYLLMNQETQEIDGVKWHRDRHNEEHEHHTINGLLGVFRVGELRKSKDYNGQFFYFSFSNKPIWSTQIKYGTNEIKGTHEVNYQQLIKKLNK